VAENRIEDFDHVGVGRVKACQFSFGLPACLSVFLRVNGPFENLILLFRCQCLCR
jgi:hypothetical protein